MLVVKMRAANMLDAKRFVANLFAARMCRLAGWCSDVWRSMAAASMLVAAADTCQLICVNLYILFYKFIYLCFYVNMSLYISIVCVY